LRGATSHNGRAVLLDVSIATTSTTTDVVMKVDPLLAGGRLHEWLGISHLTVVVALIV
jgi:hypothetical protein